MTLAHQKTIETYNRAADFLVEHFELSGNRVGDVVLGFALAGNPENAKVLEIGCGYGRDAREILHRTPFYTGLDASKRFLQKARERFPQAQFIEADAEDYQYPETEYNIVFSFATLRHFNQEGIQTVIKKVYDSLQPGGLFYLSLNFGEKYEHVVRKDKYGHRDIYLYNPQLIQKLAGPHFKLCYQQTEEFDGRRWFEVALQKPA